MLIAGFNISLHAQLNKTKWSGTINVSQQSGTTPMDVIWEFSNDTATATVTGGEPEVFTYTKTKNLLTMTKVSGGSDCPVGATSKMQFSIKGKELTLIPKGSTCETYAKATADKPYSKVE